MKIITDEDLATIPMEIAIEAVHEFFQSAARGSVVTPPRHTVKAGQGGLTFTIGAELETSKTVGFRVYDTYPNQHGTKTDQIVAVYATEQSRLKGIIVGSAIGAIRTAAINGHAANLLAPPTSKTVCLIGAGHQAYYQIQAILAVRTPTKVILCNRTPARAEQLAARLRQTYQAEFIVSHSVEESVRQADIVLCATNSTEPVIESSWLNAGAYLSSIGPKFEGRHELPTDIQAGAKILVSDAPQQIASYSAGYFLEDTSAIVPLEAVPVDVGGQGYAVFLSTGRSGTEVIVADKIFDYLS